jgi:hypothetical protein
MSLATSLRRLTTFAAVVLPAALSAQAASAPRIDISGILFGAYSYRTNPEAKNANKFDLERVYLNFRTPIADRWSLRYTPDISPQQAGVGYVLRTKYAYVQYDRPANKAGWSGLVRAGSLQTVALEHMETFWPRWMGTAAAERFGYFSSADVGVGAQLNFPKKRGELYAVWTNGNGYANPETDRFKSYAARLSLTPLAGGKHGLLTTFAVSPWIDINAAASKFVQGGTGQVGAIGEGLTKNRFGIWTGIKDPRLVVAAGYSQRVDGTESGANTAVSPRHVTDVTGDLITGLVLVRPMQLADSASKSPLSVMLRYDAIKPNTDLSASNHMFEGSLIFDLTRNKRTQLALDYQETLGTAPAATIAPSKMFQVRLVTNF